MESWSYQDISKSKDPRLSSLPHLGTGIYHFFHCCIFSPSMTAPCLLVLIFAIICSTNGEEKQKSRAWEELWCVGSCRRFVVAQVLHCLEYPWPGLLLASWQKGWWYHEWKEANRLRMWTQYIYRAKDTAFPVKGAHSPCLQVLMNVPNFLWSPCN